MNSVVLLAIALAPGAAIGLYIYFKDKYEREPVGLVVASFFMGVVSTVVVGAAYESGKSRGPVPLGTPCGVQDGVPQICWTQPGGGYEGTDVLPYSAPSPVVPRVPGLSLDLILQEAPQPARSSAPPAGQ